MNVNPYQSPTETESPAAEILPERAAALRIVHRAILILAVPAVVNYICWGLLEIRGMLHYPSACIFMSILNLILVSVVSTVLWFGSLRILENIASALHFIFGGPISREEWLSAMYGSLWTLKWVAPIGAAVWLIWLMLIYGLRVNFMVASVPLGIVGHLLGACVYVTIFYNWYRARR